MLRFARLILILISLAAITTTAFSQTTNSVLEEGQWVKLAIKKDGVYKISHANLQSMGFNPSSIDPTKLKIYGNGAGMLPQESSVSRPVDLIENRILVHGQDDGRFDNGDYILFYAQGADRYKYDGDGKLQYEHNLYSDHNYYFLTIGKENGLRVANASNLGSNFPKIDTFNDFRYYKKEGNNLLMSGRVWYSEKYDNTTTSRSYSFNFKEIAPNTDIKITSAVMAQSFAESKFTIALNGNEIGDQIISDVPDFRNKIFRYSIKGSETVSEFIANSGQSPSDEIRIGLNYEKNNSGQSIGFMNYLLLETICKLVLNEDNTVFRSVESSKNVSSTFEVGGINSQSQIWEITNPLAPANQKFSISGASATFGVNTEEIKEFVVFDITKLPSPDFELIDNQNIRSISTPDMLIVTYPGFLPEAKRLAQFRKSNDNLTVEIVTSNQIYNEFSSGKQDVTAIRDYVRHLYKTGSKLKYLLLFGKSSYDYKNLISDNTNFVPIYQSRNSLHPLETFASDDYYGFLEDSEGAWNEQADGNHSLEIGIGRLPVKTIDEAKNVVDKIIRYASDPKSLGSWRNEIIFVADDGDNNTHAKHSDQLAVLVDTSFSNFNYNKVFLDAYPQISSPNGETSPKASEALNNAVEQGALIVNFTGHGSELVWMQEQVLDYFTIESWQNIHNLPLFVTATCEFSRHDDPKRASGGEVVVINPNGGGIAIISTSRPVYSSSNFELNKAFYHQAFRIEDGEYLRLGDIIRSTKNNSIDKASDINKVGNRNFVLLGDPSIKLSYPKKKIAITAINDNTSKTDTLKALGTIKITGELREISGHKDNTFNGELEVLIHDKESSLTTLGNENMPYTYKSRENAIFRGKASINDGGFSFEFVVPKNISYQPGNGKISLYAISNNRKEDANGGEIDIITGGTAPQPVKDNMGPSIKLYFGDSTYTGSGYVNSNTLLIAKLEDESGINISSYGVGNSIIATLDGDQTFILNDYYTAQKDSYKKGQIMFPLNNLAKGKHKITVKAWDTHNNPGETTIEFIVSDPGSFSISNLYNYPNPFHDYTTLAFEHNRPGEDLEVNLQIISREGRIIRDLDFIINESNTRVDLFEWDGTNTSGQKLDRGIYLFKVSVRSLLDGAKNQQYKKLILIN